MIEVQATRPCEVGNGSFERRIEGRPAADRPGVDPGQHRQVQVAAGDPKRNRPGRHHVDTGRVDDSVGEPRLKALEGDTSATVRVPQAGDRIHADWQERAFVSQPSDLEVGRLERQVPAARRRAQGHRALETSLAVARFEPGVDAQRTVGGELERRGQRGSRSEHLEMRGSHTGADLRLCERTSDVHVETERAFDRELWQVDTEPVRESHQLFRPGDAPRLRVEALVEAEAGLDPRHDTPDAQPVARNDDLVFVESETRIALEWDAGACSGLEGHVPLTEPVLGVHIHLSRDPCRDRRRLVQEVGQQALRAQVFGRHGEALARPDHAESAAVPLGLRVLRIPLAVLEAPSRLQVEGAESVDCGFRSCDLPAQT